MTPPPSGQSSGRAGRQVWVEMEESLSGVPGAAGGKRPGNMAAAIYDQVRSDILSGALAPGDPISQLTLAAAHGTSRGPVREALMRLHQDQLVVGRANHRFNVAAFDVSDMETLFSLHLSTAALAIRVGVPFLTDAELQELDHSVAAMAGVSAADEPGWEAAYRALVLTLVKHAGARTVALVAELIDNTQRHHKASGSRLPHLNPTDLSVQEIVEAARQRDGRRASSLYAQLISRTSMLILAGAAPHYEPSRLRGYILALAGLDGA